MAAAPAAHRRQHRLDHRDRAEDIHLELVDQLRQGRLFEDALMTIAGVVDQDIDRAHVCLDLAHGRVDGIEVRDVDDHPVGALAVQSFKCKPLFFTPHRADHSVSGLQRGFGKGAAETCAGAGDQESLRLCVLHRKCLAGRCCLAVG